MNTILVAEDDATTSHLLQGVLESAGYLVKIVSDGDAALKQLRKKPVDLLLTDIWMPRVNGLELLARLKEAPPPHPRVIVMTSDDTPETLLQAVRAQAYQYLRKPIEPKALVELVRDTLAADPLALPIEVISAKPEWVELLVPCDLATAERITGFMNHLRADLPEEVRERVGPAFRELLTNAIEWGGKLDPNQKVRISYLRAKRMVLYRIADPGTGFCFSDLSHAAVSNPEDSPFEHDTKRVEKGLRPGGFGIMLAKSMVDELLYNEAHNEVVFIQYLDEGKKES